MDNHSLPGKTGINDNRKKLLWTALSVLIAGLSVWAVTSQWKEFSLEAFAAFVAEADDRWLAGAVLAMLGFIFFEGMAVRSACRVLSYPVSVRSGFAYAAADIYFSAITPSASGGQPACALLMVRDGIPGMVTTAVLLLTLAMYAASILCIGLISFLLRPNLLIHFTLVSRVLIAVGYAAQIGLALFFFLLIRSERLLEKICFGVLGLLTRLRLLRRGEERQTRLREIMAEYRDSAALLAGHRTLLLRSFVFNFLQRASQIAVTVLVYLAAGGSPAHAADVFAMQSYVVIGSNCVPIPGAMGVVDFLMLDAFGSVLPAEEAVSLELLSRSVSFYFCVLLCGIVFLLAYRRKRKG